VTKGDSEEFTTYVAARLDRWRRVAYLLSRDWHTADDLVSTMVGKLYRGWRRINAVENVDAYAQRMLTRAWLDETRRRSRRRERSTSQPMEVGSSATQSIDDRDALWQLLGSLGKRQRAVIVLRFYLDLSVEETAEILGIAPGTVKSQSARGLETLRVLAAGEARH
jgi:RNA polymerase sigma-70 factor (sigma-E family)